jgi:precorrin-6Y C5,15-methyltransferase (decarboxylating)
VGRGRGCGSIGIEWMRAPAAAPGHRGRRRPPGLHRTQPRCPGRTRPATGSRQGPRRCRPGAPDAIFIGGGVTREGVLDLCWASLAPAAGWWPTP